MNFLKYKCPICRSENISIPDSSMFFVYMIDPIECNDCDAEFENNIITRIYLWLLIVTTVSPLIFPELLLRSSSKHDIGLIILFSIRALFSLIFVGLIVEMIKSWQFTIIKSSLLKRKIINYSFEGSIWIVGILALIGLLSEQ